MKKTLIAAILLFIFQFSIFNSLHAQDDLYVVEQAFPGAIRQLSIMNGWTVKLIYTPGEDSTRVSVITPCSYFFAEGNEPLICTLREGRLAIHQNRTMPIGTQLEVRYPEPLEMLLVPAGQLELDTVHMQLHSEGPRAAGIMPSRSTTLKINHLSSDGDIGIDCRHDHSSVSIGTVHCRNLYVDEKHRDRIHIDRLEADSLVVVPHHWWDDINYSSLLFIGGKAGGASLMSKNATPYSTSFALSVDFFVRLMEAPLSRKWTLSTGVGFGLDENVLSYDVLLEDGQIVFNPNHTVDHPISVLMQNYIALPLKLQYRPQGHWARLFCNHLDFSLEPRLSILGGVAGWRDGEPFTDMTDLFSRFQLRFAVSNTLFSSMVQDHISGGMTVELYVDLLPTFRPSAGARGLHQIGIAIRF